MLIKKVIVVTFIQIQSSFTRITNARYVRRLQLCTSQYEIQSSCRHDSVNQHHHQLVRDFVATLYNNAPIPLGSLVKQYEQTFFLLKKKPASTDRSLLLQDTFNSTKSLLDFSLSVFTPSINICKKNVNGIITS